MQLHGDTLFHGYFHVLHLLCLSHEVMYLFIAYLCNLLEVEEYNVNTQPSVNIQSSVSRRTMSCRCSVLHISVFWWSVRYYMAVLSFWVTINTGMCGFEQWAWALIFAFVFQGKFYIMVLMQL